MCHRYAVPRDVLHLLSSNRRRGAETFGYELHHALIQRDVRSDIRSLVPGSGSRLPVPPLGRSRHSPLGFRALRSVARDARVVVAHGSSTLLACGAGLAGTGVPFIYLSIGDPRYWAGSWPRRVRARWLIRRAEAVVAISPSARDVLISHYGLAPERVHVIPNGRAADRFQPVNGAERQAARRALGIPDGGDVVVVIGALSAEKRVDVAIEAAGRLEDVVLVVAGDGSERDALEVLAGRLAPGRVRFLGAVDDPTKVLAAADVLALSSDSEGVPGVIIEAGLSGLPVVATNVGWVSDVVCEGETGLLVKPGQPEQLAASIESALAARDELGRAARAHCLAEFAMGTVTDLWQSLIEATAGRRNAT